MVTTQHRNEIAFLTAVAVAIEADAYLEIGVRQGISFRAVLEALADAGGEPIGMGVDLPGGGWGRVESKNHLEQVRTHLHNVVGLTTEMVYGDSHDPTTLHELLQLSEEKHGLKRGFSLMYIDGDHTQDGVAMDCEMYGHLAPVVAFDDIFMRRHSIEKAPGVQPGDGGVPRFWVDLIGRSPTNVAFLDTWSREGERNQGIGYMIKDAKLLPIFKTLLEEHSDTILHEWRGWPHGE